MPASRRIDARVILALLLVQLFFGGFGVVGKFVLVHVPPLAVAGFRVLFAAPILIVFAWWRDRCIPSPKDLAWLALLGLFGVCLNQVLFIVGLQHTSAVNAAILMPSIPVFTLLVGTVLRIERWNPRNAAAVVLTAIGALVMLDVSNFHLDDNTILGNTLVLLNCLSYAIFLVLSRPVLLRLKPLTVIAGSYFFGGLGVLFITGSTLATMDYTLIPASAWMGIAYIVLLATLVGYVLNTYAIHRSSPTVVATFTTLQPVIAGALAVLFLDENVTGKEFAGFFLIVSGLLWISMKKRSSDSH